MDNKKTIQRVREITDTYRRNPNKTIKAVAMLKDTEEYKLLANAYNVLGFSYNEQENFQMALASYDKAYRILRKHRIYDDTIGFYIALEAY